MSRSTLDLAFVNLPAWRYDDPSWILHYMWGPGGWLWSKVLGRHKRPSVGALACGPGAGAGQMILPDNFQFGSSDPSICRRRSSDHEILDIWTGQSIMTGVGGRIASYPVMAGHVWARVGIGHLDEGSAWPARRRAGLCGQWTPASAALVT